LIAGSTNRKASSQGCCSIDMPTTSKRATPPRAETTTMIRIKGRADGGVIAKMRFKYETWWTGLSSEMQGQ